MEAESLLDSLNENEIEPEESYIEKRLNLMGELAINENWIKELPRYSREMLIGLLEKGVALELGFNRKRGKGIYTTKSPRVVKVEDKRGKPIIIYNGFSNAGKHSNILSYSWEIEPYGKGLPAIVNPFTNTFSRWGITWLLKTWLYWCSPEKMNYYTWCEIFRAKFDLTPMLTPENIIQMLEDLKLVKDKRGRNKFNHELINYYISEVRSVNEYTPKLLNAWHNDYYLIDWWHDDGVTYAKVRKNNNTKKGEPKEKIIEFTGSRWEVEYELYKLTKDPVNYMYPETNTTEYGVTQDRAIDKNNLYERISKSHSSANDIAEAMKLYKESVCSKTCPKYNSCNSYCNEMIEDFMRIWNEFTETKEIIPTKKRERHFTFDYYIDAEVRTPKATKSNNQDVEILSPELINYLIEQKNIELNIEMITDDNRYRSVEKAQMYLRKLDIFEELMAKFINTYLRGEQTLNSLLNELRNKLPIDYINYDNENYNYWELLAIKTIIDTKEDAK